MSFLDKDGLNYFWQQIVAKIGRSQEELKEYTDTTVASAKNELSNLNNRPEGVLSNTITAFIESTSETVDDVFVSDCAVSQGLYIAVIETAERKYASPIFYYDCHSLDYSFSFVNTSYDTIVSMRLHCENEHDLFLDVHRGGSVGLSTFTISIYKLWDL